MTNDRKTTFVLQPLAEGADPNASVIFRCTEDGCPSPKVDGNSLEQHAQEHGSTAITVVQSEALLKDLQRRITR